MDTDANGILDEVFIFNNNLEWIQIISGNA